jgi:hypothetical protein
MQGIQIGAAIAKKMLVKLTLKHISGKMKRIAIEPRNPFTK